MIAFLALVVFRERDYAVAVALVALTAGLAELGREKERAAVLKESDCAVRGIVGSGPCRKMEYGVTVGFGEYRGHFVKQTVEAVASGGDFELAAIFFDDEFIRSDEEFVALIVGQTVYAGAVFVVV